MDNQVMKKISPPISDPSYLLAQKALNEMKKYGAVQMKCPKCQTIPIVKTILKDDGDVYRVSVRCVCNYVKYGVIYD